MQIGVQSLIRLLFLIPLVLCTLWVVYLKSKGYTLAQGKQGFQYILIISAVIAAAYTFLYFVTQYQ